MAVRIQAAVRGHFVRSSLAETRALCAFGPTPPNMCMLRVHGKVRAVDFSYAKQSASTILAPLSLSEALVISPFNKTTSPSALAHGNRQPVDAWTSPNKKSKGPRGAAARKAAITC